MPRPSQWTGCSVNPRSVVRKPKWRRTAWTKAVSIVLSCIRGNGSCETAPHKVSSTGVREEGPGVNCPTTCEIVGCWGGYDRSRRCAEKGLRKPPARRARRSPELSRRVIPAALRVISRRSRKSSVFALMG
jgi:hypothetical protein